MAESVTYAGRTVTLDDIVNARTAIEEMATAHKESVLSDDIHFGGTSTTMDAVRDVCMLASAMWYQLKRSDDTAQLLEQAKRELDAFRRKYAQLDQLAKVFRAIEELDAA